LHRATNAVGLKAERVTHIFAATLPFFVAVRMLTKWKGGIADRVRPLPSFLERVLLALSRLDEMILRRWNLPAGSSVVMLARKLPS
jgi:hypothetical protein